MASTQQHSFSALDEAYGLLKTHFSTLIEVIRPDDICDDLYSNDILSDDILEFVTNEEKPVKARNRKLLHTAFQEIRGNHERFDTFIKTLERKELAKELCTKIRGIMKGNSLMKFHELKSELSILRRSILQSDDNIDAKYTLMKEFIISFFKNQFEGSVPKEQLLELLNKLCYDEMIIPPKLYSWSFAMLDEITQKAAISVTTYEAAAPLQPKKKFSDAIVHHCLILCCLLTLDDYKKFLDRSGHDFDELSVSLHPEDSKLERCVIAKREKDKELYIAFLGEPDLQVWQKSRFISEGISKQTNRLPVHFFVEQIQNGYSIIFTGYAFGGLLALSVYTSVWNQACLSISNLSQNTMCITFGVPVIPLKTVEDTLEHIPEMKENSHIFHYQGDFVPRLLRFDDISSTNGTELPDKFPGRIGAVIISHICKYKEAVEQESIEGPLSDLKTFLSDDNLTKLPEAKLLGTYHYIHSQMAELVVSQLASQSAQDSLKIPSPAELDNIPQKSNIMKEHSLWKYYDLLKKSFIKSSDFKSISVKNLLLLEPEVSSVTFYRHGKNIALELKGQNLWFCFKINIKSKSGSIFIDTLEANGTSRSVHFNYTPKDENDLIIERHTTAVNIVLYSHFVHVDHNSTKPKVPAKYIGEYHVSYRQRQLAICTPAEVITLSFLSALLECKPSGTASSRYTAICQFLEEASRIVPIESIFFAIANAPHEVAWKCTEAFMSTGVSIPPSLQLSYGLAVACTRLTFGFNPALIHQLQRQIPHFIKQISSSTGMHVSVPPVVNVNVCVQSAASDFKKENSGAILPVHATHTSQKPVQPSTTLLTKMNKLCERAGTLCMQNNAKKTLRVISGKNIEELFSTGKKKGNSNKLLSPIEVLKMGRSKLDRLHTEALENSILDMLDKPNEEAKKYYNEEMLANIQSICNNELCICVLLLGGFMEQQIRVPLVKSPMETAHILQTTEAPPAVGVWALFSLGMFDFEKMCTSEVGEAMVINVEKYIKGIFGEHMQAQMTGDEFYAGKLQFLLQCINETVSCNSSYISYSLEAQLAEICSKRDIKPTTRVKKLVEQWDVYFEENLLYHILQPFRPLVARWIIWCLNIHHLREELASHVTVGITGLNNSGKSCLVKTLFKQKATVGSTSMQRTTVSFLYDLEGLVDGLSVIDFPGVDDAEIAEKDMSSRLLLQLSQLFVFVLDYKKWESKAAFDWIKFFKNSGVPILICLSHADKLYSSMCIGDDGAEICSIDKAKRLIQQELEKVHEKLAPLPNWQVGFYSFCQDKDSSMNCEEGRQTLSDVGILSCNDVGAWLEKELRDHLKEEGIAERLKFFLASGLVKHNRGSKSTPVRSPTSKGDIHSQHDEETRLESYYTTPFEACEAIVLLRNAEFGFRKSFHDLLAELHVPTNLKQTLKDQAKYDGHDYEFATENAIDWWMANRGKTWDQFLAVIKKCELVTASKIEAKLL